MQINFLAVVVSAVATFIIGALWYSPILFGKLWMKAHAYTEEKLKEMQKGVMRAYAVSFVCYLVMAAVLSGLMGLTNTATATGGMWIGFLCWLGFAATIGLTANMFSEKSLSTYLIDVGYQLVYLLVMGAILGAWR
jgi:hypothetical protein